MFHFPVFTSVWGSLIQFVALFLKALGERWEHRSVSVRQRMNNKESPKSSLSHSYRLTRILNSWVSH